MGLATETFPWYDSMTCKTFPLQVTLESKLAESVTILVIYIMLSNKVETLVTTLQHVVSL